MGNTKNTPDGTSLVSYEVQNLGISFAEQVNLYFCALSEGLSTHEGLLAAGQISSSSMHHCYINLQDQKLR